MEQKDSLRKLNVYKSIPKDTEILYKLLLDVLQSEYFDSFKNIIEQHSKMSFILNINYVYPNTGETFLDIASKNGLTEFVEFLLLQGADPNRVNLSHNRAPIHFATAGRHVNTLAALLKEPKTDPNLEAGFQTALHFAVINNDLNCADLLLEKGASASISNSVGLTALHLAAKSYQRDMVQLILGKSKQLPNVDTYKDCIGNSTRKVIQENLGILLPEYESGVDVQVLKYHLIVNNETNFLESMRLVKTEDLHGAADKLFEMAAQRGFYRAAISILKKIKGEQFSIKQAAQTTIQWSEYVVLQVLLQVRPDIANNLLLSACVELGVPRKERANQLACLKLILEQRNVNVRCSDKKGNTPLHYAARAGCREAVDLLLNRGSYIGHMNKSNVPPIADIPAHTLSRYFDECLQKQEDCMNEYYAIEFNYRCLMPHDVLEYENTRRVTREMEVFKYIANDNNLKHLLKHPLLSSFLCLKWHSIRHVLYANLIFYVIFYCVLNAYILSMIYDNRMGNETQISLGNTSRIVWYQINSVQAVVAIMLLLFTLREIYQFASCVRSYLMSLRNWLEIALIIFTIALLCGAGLQVSAIVILLSAWELMILVSQHSHLSISIEIFQTVSFNFIRFLFPYLFLILAFALAFYTLFKNEVVKNRDGENISFSNPGVSLFRIVIMLTGEFDASDIPFNLYPVWSHIVFILFVFFITIVFFNLLNGLISNTTEILSKTELVRLISRTHVIAYIEDTVIVKPFERHYSSCNSRLPRWKPFGFLTKKILLFPHILREGKISIKLCDSLDDNDRYYERYERYVRNESVHDRQWSTLKMDPYTIKEAKRIVSNKNQMMDNERIMIILEKLQEKLTENNRE